MRTPLYAIFQQVISYHQGNFWRFKPYVINLLRTLSAWKEIRYRALPPAPS